VSGPPFGNEGSIADAATPTEPPGTSFGRAFLAALVWVGLLTVLGIALAADDAGEAGYVFGQQIVAGLLAALVTWLITRRAKRRWPFWQLVLLALPFFLLFRLLSVAGQASG